MTFVLSTRVLLRHYKEELHNLPEATEQKKERTNRQMALLCLEGIVTIVGIVCGRYPEKLTTFLLALGETSKYIYDMCRIIYFINNFSHLINSVANQLRSLQMC